MPAVIRTVGLTELRRAFRRMGSKALDTFLRDANARFAADINNEAQPTLAAQSRTVAKSAKVSKSAVAARIRVTSERAGGTIFGAKHDLPRVGPSGRQYIGFNQFRQATGQPFHIYPEADRLTEDGTAVDHYVDALHAFLDAEGVPRG